MTEPALPTPPADELPRHGGALAAAAARHGIAVADWLDLSTGINPTPYPAAPIAATDLARLPDPSLLASLLSAARSAYEVAPAALIAALPGSDLGLRLLPLLVPTARVAVLQPTYSGHAEAWSRAGHAVSAVASFEAAASADVVVLANPNNPDGRRLGPDRILAALADLPEHGLLVVDEAFADLEPGLSLAPHLADERLVVLRSFGKFYGLAGLRLGFALGTGGVIQRLAGLIGDWPLSGPAITIGTGALDDTAWQTATRARLVLARGDLDDLLARHGLVVTGGTDLFRLVRSNDALALHQALAERGIWTRIFAHLPGLIRFGLPPADGFDRLARALGAIRTP